METSESFLIITEKTNLQSQTASGVFWTFLEQLGRRGIVVLVTILLARFLTPDDFGLIAMVSVFFAFANALMDVGFRQALIRKQNATQIDYATMFYSNLVLGLLAYALLFFSAPAISSFYKEPRLILLVRIVGVVVLINALQFVQIVDLTRRLDFKTQFKVTIPAGIISGLAAVLLAMAGAGVWSLVAQMIFSPLIITFSLWMINTWRPTLEFSAGSFRELFGFGSKLFLSGVLDILFRNIYVIVIAKIFDATLTGYYFFATKVRDIILEQFSSSIQRVTFPALASVQSDDLRLKNGFRKVIQATTYLIFPAMVFLAVMARPLFELLLNPKWLPAVPYLQLLCAAGVMYPLHVVNLNILQVKGRSDLFLYLEVVKKIMIACVLLVSSRYGIVAILIGQIATSLLAYIPNSYFSAKLIGYTAKEQMKDVSPSLLASVIAGTGALLAGTAVGSLRSPGITLAVQVPVACGVYVLASFILKIGIQATLWMIIKERMGKLTGKKA